MGVRSYGQVSASSIIVLSRVLGMLLAAIAVQFILNGGALFIASARQ